LTDAKLLGLITKVYGFIFNDPPRVAIKAGVDVKTSMEYCVRLVFYLTWAPNFKTPQLV